MAYCTFRLRNAANSNVENNADAIHRLKPLAQALAARGLETAAELELPLGSLLPPTGMLNLEQGAEIVVDAIGRGRALVVAGDYDADGACSMALFVLYLRHCGVSNLRYAVPHRLADGYGLTASFAAKLAALDPRPELVVTADNGINSLDGAEYLKQQGIQLVVTDHHLPREELPQAAAIINPNQHGDEFPSKNLAGVGVIFYLLSAIRLLLQKRGWFSSGEPPRLADYLDLVALGTIADMVPMDLNNRILAQHGLKLIRKGRARPGIMSLLRCAQKAPKHIGSSELAFHVGPRLNAAGRLDDMTVGVDCLLAEQEDAVGLARSLQHHNRERQSISTLMLAQGEAQLKSCADQPVVCLHDPSWHQGVVGIVASSLQRKLNKPMVVFAPDQASPGQLRASARSTPGLHLLDLLTEVDRRHPGLMSRFGGHAAAAGLTLAATEISGFSKAINKVFADQFPPLDSTIYIEHDGPLDGSADYLELAYTIKLTMPWGTGFPEPCFYGRFSVNRFHWGQSGTLRLDLNDSKGKGITAFATRCDPDWRPKRGGEVEGVYRLDVDSRNTLAPVLFFEALTGV